MMTRCLILWMLVLSLAFGQSTTRQLDISWTDSDNPTGTTYDVHRAAKTAGSCGTPVKVNAASLTTKTYSDSVVPGVYCYWIVATAPGAPASPMSDPGEGTVPTFKPSAPTVTILLTVGTQFVIDDNGTLRAIAELRKVAQ